MIFCTKCGKEVQQDAAFCPACGVSRIAGAAPSGLPPVARKSRAKKIFGWIAAGFVLLVIIGLLARDAKKSSEPPAPMNDAPELRIEARQIVADYTANEVLADQKYKGKLIEVTGAIDSISKDLFDRPFVTVGSGEELELTVQCSLRNDQEGNAAKLFKGETVRVRGHCGGKMMNVQFDDCVVVAAGG